MLLAIKQNFAFLAMARCASTSIEAALAPRCDLVCTGGSLAKHMQFRRFERYVQPLAAALGASDLITACVVREPVSWLQSWYAYRARPALTGLPASTRGLSFDDFLDGYLADEQPEFARVGNQSEFVRNRKGAIGVTRIYRFDALPILRRDLEDIFLAAIEIPHVNAAPQVQADCSAAMRSRLERALPDAFELYASAIAD